jgi:hypothetical protein
VARLGRVELAKEVEQNISNRAHGFPPVTKRGSFVRSKTSSFSLHFFDCAFSCFRGVQFFFKTTNLLRQSGVLGVFLIVMDAWRCMAKSMMEDFLSRSGVLVTKRKRRSLFDALFMTLVFRFSFSDTLLFLFLPFAGVLSGCLLQMALIVR